MKKNGVDIDECAYAEMTKSVGGQSMPSEYYEEPLQNPYERKRNSAFNQSGMKGEK